MNVRVTRKNLKKLNNELNILNRNIQRTLIASGLALTVSMSAAGNAFAADTSTNLPVANGMSGAVLDYSNGRSFSPAEVNTADSMAAANASNSLNVNVNAGLAKIYYNTYNIAQGKTVNYHFTNSGQIALNKVTLNGSQYASQIFGNITQSGNSGTVLLVNPNGILFGPTASVNVGSFIGSTLNINDNDIQNQINDGSLTFTRSGNPARIYIDNGANLQAADGISFVSNVIYQAGGKVSSSAGNVQYITGDGVTFRLAEGSTNPNANLVLDSDIKASDASQNDVWIRTDEETRTRMVYEWWDVLHLFGKEKSYTVNVDVTAKLGSITLNAGTNGSISGNNVKIASKINKSFDNNAASNLVNINTPIIANQIVAGEGGDIYIYAENEKIKILKYPLTHL